MQTFDLQVSSVLLVVLSRNSRAALTWQHTRTLTTQRQANLEERETGVRCMLHIVLNPDDAVVIFITCVVFTSVFV